MLQQEEALKQLRFYAEWIGYGILLGAMIAGVALHFTARSIHPRQYGRRFFIIVSVCLLPTLVLPLWIFPLLFYVKVAGTALIAAVVFIKYLSSRQKEEEYWQSRRSKEGEAVGDEKAGGK
jgi:hypothetical protein